MSAWIRSTIVTPITIIKGQLQGMLYNVGRYKDRDAYLVESLEATEILEKNGAGALDGIGIFK